MGMICFVNPNEPEQPCKGVYRWFARSETVEFTIYVGNSGFRKESISSPSTLKRGVLEAQRSCLSSDRGSTLDTDFVAGTALMYFKRRGFTCCWEHVADDPASERQLCRKYHPFLQDDSGSIRRCFRLSKAPGEKWIRTDVALAEQRLFERFSAQDESRDSTLVSVLK